MATGSAVSAAQTLLDALQCSELKKISSIFGYKSQLAELQRTVSTVKAVLLDAEYREDLSHETQLWIQELKDAVYDANDLFDKFVTFTKRKQLSNGGKVSEKVHRFFSRENPLVVAYKMFQGVKRIRKNLDAIENNHAPFGFRVDVEPVRRRREETCSYVCKDDIIGREVDVEKIVGCLLNDSNVQQDVSCLTIAGMGGVGKTALTQLVYADARVVSAFSLRLWVGISGHDQDQLDVDGILHRIIGSTGKIDGKSNYTLLQNQVQSKLTSQKYLLVLDDVWTESRDQWLCLMKFLSGHRGSWIVTTTRSHETATIISGIIHELQGLSQEDSWCLFQKFAFKGDQLDPELVKIGREIVDGFAGLPLAIKEVGSLLLGQDLSVWHNFRVKGLVDFGQTWNTISLLKLSYDILKYPLKSCFGYCALFPEDFEIDKEMLISLWLAQGYFIPFNEGQSIKEAVEEYFLILLGRKFFQDIKKDKYGEIVSCKMHKLMHVLAQDVTGKEMYLTNTVSGNLDGRVRHLSVAKGEYDEFSLGKTHILSYLHVDYNGFPVGKLGKSYLESLLSNCLKLRALDLSGFLFQSLPDSISNLLQLRYLNLSGNIEIEVLPSSITELINLQTLILRQCHRLKELPKDLSRLANLRVLNIRNCSSLTSMPGGMDKLTSLYRLSDFIVCDEGGSSSWKQFFDGMEDLKALNNLVGHLNIQIRWPKYATSVVEEDSGRGELYLTSKEHLNAILFDFKHERGGGKVDREASGTVEREATRLMGQLKPHDNLKYLELKKYPGTKLPDWVTHLPNLVELHIADCWELEYLPSLGILPQLKVFKLIKLYKLLYIGEDSLSTDKPQLLSDCPSLETLELINLPKFIGWKREMGNDHTHKLLSDSSSSKAQLQSVPCFSQLKCLFIWNCPELTCLPPCPKVEDLKLGNFNQRLNLVKHTDGDDNIPSTSLSSMPLEAFQCLKCLEIWSNNEVESLEEFEEVFRSCSSSLRSLIINNCCNLKSVVPGGLEYLIALEVLELRNCDNLRLSGREEQAEVEDSKGKGLVPWSSNLHSLRTLTLQGLPQLVVLPDWMQFLPALQSLDISFCKQLKSMPNWMRKIVSLRQLMVSGCSKSLERRCHEDPLGEDRAYIQHISNIQFENCFY